MNAKARMAANLAMAAVSSKLFERVTSATFLVETFYMPIGRFTECQGLEVSLEYHERKEGGVNGYTHKLPGRTSWPDITLTRGITFDNNIFEWFNAAVGSDFVASGKVERQDVGITMITPNGKRIRTWVLADAIPIKWVGPQFTNDSDVVPTEQLTIAHHGFIAANLPGF
jgi:phage tail-like protein